MTSKRNAEVNVNVQSSLLYILTPNPTPGHDPGQLYHRVKA